MKGLAALLFCLAATSAHAAAFEGLFAFPDRTDLAAPSDDGSPLSTPFAPRADQAVCIAAIRQAEKAYDIPRDLLLAIGLQEAGMSYKGSMTIWPWSLNVEGRGVRFDTRSEAEAFLANELAQGTRSIDVGCLQINLRWHPDAFASPADGFDPVQSAQYAAGFLRALYAETGDWMQAAGRYHSATPEYKNIYLAGIERQLAKIGRSGGAFDSLADAAPLPQATSMVMAAGYALREEGVWMGGRRMNPLRAPVRQGDAPLQVMPALYRRSFAPPAMPEAKPVAVPDLGDPVSVPLADAPQGGRMFGGIALMPDGPPDPLPLEPGPDGLVP